MERHGVARKGSLLEQGVPIPPMPAAEAETLTLRRADGQPLRGSCGAEAKDPDGNVNWVRVSALVSLPANGRLPVRLETAEAGSIPRLDIRESADGVSVDTPSYKLKLTNPGQVELIVNGRPLLSGNWSVTWLRTLGGLFGAR